MRLPVYRDVTGAACVWLDGTGVRVATLVAREYDPAAVAQRAKQSAEWRYQDVRQRRLWRERRKRKAWAAAGIVDEFE